MPLELICRGCGKKIAYSDKSAAWRDGWDIGVVSLDGEGLADFCGSCSSSDFILGELRKKK